MRWFALVVVALSFVAACRKATPRSADAGAGGGSGAGDVPTDPAAVVTKLAGFRDAACACANPACVNAVERDMRNWLLKAGPSMQHLQGTAEQTAAAQQASAAMDACVDRILHPR